MYKSDQQRKFFHSKGAKKAGISEATVKEYDEASRGKKLPRYAKLRKLMGKKDG